MLRILFIVCMPRAVCISSRHPLSLAATSWQWMRAVVSGRHHRRDRRGTSSSFKNRFSVVHRHHPLFVIVHGDHRRQSSSSSDKWCKETSSSFIP